MSHSVTSDLDPHRVNVADRLCQMAEQMPDALAVVSPRAGRGAGYDTISFAELDGEATRLARGLIESGVRPGMRLVLLVPCGIEFVTLVLALLRSGAATVMIDPGMGRRHLLDCLTAVNPAGFVGIPRAQMVRVVMRRRFGQARYNVTVGRRWFWGGHTLASLRKLGERSRAALPNTRGEDPAAIIFTSGSTGPPKGVLYCHETFAAQAEEIRDYYGIEPGGVDLACFPLFGLFNAVMGTTTVFPRMDFSRPASADPSQLLQAARDWQVTQAFASPAVWDNVSRYCEQTGERIDTLERVLSCGAPVPASVIKRTLACVHPQAQMHTPYGATEALPVSSIDDHQVLGETAAQTDEGAGICVGHRFPSIDWKVIRVDDRPIPTTDDAEPLPTGEIGELIVRGRQVTTAYVTGTDWNARAKIRDGDSIWHRMGDVGYLDESGRFWYCGRLNHRVVTAQKTLYTIPVEAVFNGHPRVLRSALVGAGERGRQRPVIIVEPAPSETTIGQDETTTDQWRRWLRDTRDAHNTTLAVAGFSICPALPVDARHNSKINRERLATQLGDAWWEF